MIRGVGLISVLAGIAVIALAVPNGAVAAVNVGQTFTPSEPDSCGGVAEEGEQVQTNRADGTSYAAPSAGVLTSWSFQAGAQITLLTLRVFHPTGIADHYLVIADADPQPQIVFESSGLQTFPTRVPVQAGDLIGIHSVGGECASVTGNDLDTIDDQLGPITPVGEIGSYSSGARAVLDIQARLEPDCNHNGLGDETQESNVVCPTGPTGQRAAALKKCKKKRSAKARRKCRKKAKLLPV